MKMVEIRKLATEDLNKKLEEYIDTADSKESQINYI